ncbi:MAG: CRISPR-associated endonuclease Cas1 [Candidatus Bathyarchaeia archaeon]
MGRKIKVEKIILDSFGNFLGMEKGCIILRDKHGKEKRYPMFEVEIGEVVLMSGNLVSTGVLSALGFWEIDVLVTTRNGYPIAMLKNLEDDAHVKTRICQYEALKNGKGVYVAKHLVIGKVEGQNILLNKYGLKPNQSINQIIESLEESDLRALRKRLLSIEGKHGEYYFRQIFQLLPENLRPVKRVGFKAYEGINNTFNLAYTILFWKCYRALIKAHLEPYLGFLHNIQYGRPSLVCDFVELYRHLVDDFLIQYCQNLKPKDFSAKTETWEKKKGKRIYLNHSLTNDLTNRLNDYFKQTVKVPRMKRGNNQELETLINEEALLLGKYLRSERESWNPRIAIPLSKEKN